MCTFLIKFSSRYSQIVGKGGTEAFVVHVTDHPLEDIHGINKHGNDLIRLAAKDGHTEMVELLVTMVFGVLQFFPWLLRALLVF